MTRSTVNSYAVQSTSEDDDDLELVVDSDEDYGVDNDRKDDVMSESSMANDKANQRLGGISKKKRHYLTQSISLEMDYQEDPPFKS
ncbi:hypothetical protein WUBG_11829 [Wuchereria bancrofti]|nr:hypothetical protein WUBG_11829 [Wuchereria bancrofti]